MDEKATRKIERLVLIYKQFKDPQAFTELLFLLKPITKTYEKILIEQKICYHSKSALQFYATLLGPEVLNYKESQESAIQNRMGTFLKTYGAQDPEDIRQDIYSAIMIMINRYKSEGRSFLTYLSRCLHFEIARKVKAHAKSLTLWHSNVTHYGDGFGDLVGGETKSEDPFFDESGDEFGYLKEEWIEQGGDEVFADLSSFERRILFLYYQEELNDRQISKLLGMHINTVNQRRREAAEKLSQKTGLPVRRERKSGKKARVA